MGRLEDIVDSKYAVGAAIVLLLAFGLGSAYFMDGLGQLFGGDTASSLCPTSSTTTEIVSNVDALDGKKAAFITASAGCDGKIFASMTSIASDALTVEEDGETYRAMSDLELGFIDYSASFVKGVRPDTQEVVYRGREKVVSCSGLLGYCTEADYQACVDWYNSDSAAKPVGPYGEEDKKEITSRLQSSPYVTQDGNPYTDSLNLHCYRKEPVGTVAKLQNDGETYFEGKFKACAGDSCGTTNISSDKKSAAVTVDGQKVAQVTTVGSYMGDVNQLDWTGYMAMSDAGAESPENEINWKLTKQSLYEDYKSGYYSSEASGTPIESCISALDSNTIGPSEVSDCIAKKNSQANKVLTDQTNVFQNSLSDWVEGIETRGSDFHVVAKQGEKVNVPDFRIYGSYDWIGFGLAVAQPEIQAGELGDVDLAGKGETTVKVPVKNTADVAGEIETSVSCDNPVSGGSQTKEVDAGETRNFFVTLSADSSYNTTASCDVEAFDTDYSSASGIDSASFDVEVTANFADDDGDGVPNKWDSCNGEKGPASNSGCPVEEICGDGIDNDGDGSVDEGCDNQVGDGNQSDDCEPLWTAPKVAGKPLYTLENPFCDAGLSEKVHWIFAAVLSAIAGFAGFNVVKWIDGEYLMSGGFNPLAQRENRVGNGRSLVALIGLIPGLYIGFKIGMWIPVYLQLGAVLVALLFAGLKKIYL